MALCEPVNLYRNHFNGNLITRLRAKMNYKQYTIKGTQGLFHDLFFKNDYHGSSINFFCRMRKNNTSK